MKTIKLYAAFLLAIALTNYGYSQEQAIASAQIANNQKEKAVSTATDADVEEKIDQEDEPKFTLSGSIDTYFRSAFGYKSISPATSFAEAKGFSLGMANLIASYEGEKVGFTADLVFGPRGQGALFNMDPETGSLTGQRIINQLYAYYKLSDNVKLNMGQFNTFLGYEVISPTVNFHYSTSYLFSYGPFNHTGLRADFGFGGGFVGKLAIMNPTDMVEFNPVNTYTLGAQFGHESEAGGVWLNFLYGDQDGKLKKEDFEGDIYESYGSLFQADITAGFNLSDNFYLGLNSSYQTIASGEAYTAEGDVTDLDGDATSFFGVAIYPKVTLSDAFALGLRVENFAIKKGHLGILDVDDKGKGSVTAFTLSANYKVGGLTIIPEFRADKASEKSFLDKNSKEKDMLTSFTLAAVYQF